MKQNFIKTTDEKTANQLIVNGFKMISHVGTVYTFVNDIQQRLNFDAIDKTKIVYDNKLCL